MAQDIQRLVENEPGIVRAGRPLAMYLGPDEGLVTLDVEFEKDTDSHDIAHTVERTEHAIRRSHPMVKRIHIETRRLAMITHQVKDAS